MTTKKITIAGKEISLAYCFATEIAFQKYTGTVIDDFNAQDPTHCMYLILSSAISYAQGKGEEPQLKDEDIIYQSAPQEIINALNVVLELRTEWYKAPANEPKESKEEEGEKPKN